PTSSDPSTERRHKFLRDEAEASLLLLIDKCSSRLVRPPQNPLQPEDKYKVTKAFNVVARYIIGTKRLVVSTVGNATSPFLEDCLFRDSKHVAVIIDEAGLETDADLIHILAGLFTEDRVQHDFGGENPILAVVLVGDHKQG